MLFGNLGSWGHRDVPNLGPPENGLPKLIQMMCTKRIQTSIHEHTLPSVFDLGPFFQGHPFPETTRDFGVWFPQWIFSWIFSGHFPWKNEQEKIHRKIHQKIHEFQGTF